MSEEVWGEEGVGDDACEELDKGLYEGAGFVFGRCGETGPEDFVSCWPRIGVAMVATVPQ